MNSDESAHVRISSSRTPIGSHYNSKSFGREKIRLILPLEKTENLPIIGKIFLGYEERWIYFSHLATFLHSITLSQPLTNHKICSELLSLSSPNISSRTMSSNSYIHVSISPMSHPRLDNMSCSNLLHDSIVHTHSQDTHSMNRHSPSSSSVYPMDEEVPWSVTQ